MKDTVTHNFWSDTDQSFSDLVEKTTKLLVTENKDDSVVRSETFVPARACCLSQTVRHLTGKG